ncbi:unnamed protein product, partial [Mesorhabditis spiculigera]
MRLLLTLFLYSTVGCIKVYKDIVLGETFVEEWEPHKNISEHIVEFASEMAPYYFAANYDDDAEFRTEKVRDTRYEIDKVVKHHWREITYRNIDDVKEKFHNSIIPYAKEYRAKNNQPIAENLEEEVMNFLEDLRFKYIRMFVSRNSTRHDDVYIPVFVEMALIRQKLTPRVMLIKDLYDLVEEDTFAAQESQAAAALKEAQKKVDKELQVTLATLLTTGAPEVTKPVTVEAEAKETTAETTTAPPTVETEAPKTTEAITSATTTTAEVKEAETTVAKKPVADSTAKPKAPGRIIEVFDLPTTYTKTPKTIVAVETTEEATTEATTTEAATETTTEATTTEAVTEATTEAKEDSSEETATEEAVTESPEEEDSESAAVEGGQGDGAEDDEELARASEVKRHDITYLIPQEA